MIEERVSFNLKKNLGSGSRSRPPVSCSAYLLMDRRWPPPARAHILFYSLTLSRKREHEWWIYLSPENPLFGKSNGDKRPAQQYFRSQKAAG